MAIIKKKTWPEYFERVVRGEKKFDIRVADFPVQKGDVLVLEEWDPVTKEYTGKSISKTIGYVGTFSLDAFGAARAAEVCAPCIPSRCTLASLASNDKSHNAKRWNVMGCM